MLNFEVIVVDNASSDGSVVQIEKEFPQVELIANIENLGFATANNQGLKVSKGRHLLLLNSDTIVLERALNKIVLFADTQSSAGIIGCRILNSDMTLQRSCFKFPSLLNMGIAVIYFNQLFSMNKFWGRERMTWWNYEEEREVDVVLGAFMLVRREAFLQVGGLDESFFMYGEETDWCWQFKKNGWKVLYAPVAKIVHLGGQSSKQVKRKMLLQLRSGILKFIKKNRHFGIYILACVLTSVWFLVRIPPWILLMLIKPGQWSKILMRINIYFEGAWKSLCGWQMLSSK